MSDTLERSRPGQAKTASPAAHAAVIESSSNFWGTVSTLGSIILTALLVAADKSGKRRRSIHPLAVDQNGEPTMYFEIGGSIAAPTVTLNNTSRTQYLTTTFSGDVASADGTAATRTVVYQLAGPNGSCDVTQDFQAFMSGGVVGSNAFPASLKQNGLNASTLSLDAIDPTSGQTIGITEANTASPIITLQLGTTGVTVTNFDNQFQDVSVSIDQPNQGSFTLESTLGPKGNNPNGNSVTLKYPGDVVLNEPVDIEVNTAISGLKAAANRPRAHDEPRVMGTGAFYYIESGLCPGMVVTNSNGLLVLAPKQSGDQDQMWCFDSIFDPTSGVRQVGFLVHPQSDTTKSVQYCGDNEQLVLAEYQTNNADNFLWTLVLTPGNAFEIMQWHSMLIAHNPRVWGPDKGKCGTNTAINAQGNEHDAGNLIWSLASS